MGEHAITFDWPREYESLRMQGHWWLDLFKVLPIFPYVCTGSNDSIYGTSIIVVVDIPCRNSPYYVAYTRTGIFEPSVYLSGCKNEWQACVVAYSCDKLLASHAILAGISIPPIPWLIADVGDYQSVAGVRGSHKYTLLWLGPPIPWLIADVGDYQSVAGVRGSPKYALLWLGKRWCAPHPWTHHDKNWGVMLVRVCDY